MDFSLLRKVELKIFFAFIPGLEDEHMTTVPWETSSIYELDLTSTELSAQCLENILLRMPGFTYLALGYCEFFNDKVSDCNLKSKTSLLLSVLFQLQ